MKLYTCSYTTDIVYGRITEIYEGFETEYFGFVKRNWAVMNMKLDFECELDRSDTLIGKIHPIIKVFSYPNHVYYILKNYTVENNIIIIYIYICLV